MGEMWKKVTFKNYFLTAIIINVVVALALLIFKGLLPPLVPLFYGRPVGATQLTTSLGLIIAPVVSSLLIVLNLCLSLLIKDDFLKKVLAISAVVVSILTTITIMKIILLVGFF